MLSSVVANSDGSTTITGSLNGRASASFTLEFFSNTACDPSGYGEGQRVIGTTSVATGANGSNVFTATFTNTVPAGQFITATATDSSANTSEFSACLRVLGQLRFTLPVLAGPNLLLASANGPPGGTYRLLSSTNLTLPRASWTQLTSGSFDDGGNASVTLTVTGTDLQRFYVVAIP